MTVYAVGDIHGSLSKLEIMLPLIRQDHDPDVSNTIVFLGDYIDRGPDSRQVVELLMTEPLKGFKHVFLRGNHEDMMVKAMDGDSRMMRIWVNNGGATTLKNFEDSPALRIDRCVAWMRELPYYYEKYGYLFVHAGIRPRLPLSYQQTEDMMWIREEFTNSEEDHGYVVVHGHTPLPKHYEGPNRINLDTGACYGGGTLTAVKLDSSGEREFFHV